MKTNLQITNVTFSCRNSIFVASRNFPLFTQHKIKTWGGRETTGYYTIDWRLQNIILRTFHFEINPRENANLLKVSDVKTRENSDVVRIIELKMMIHSEMETEFLKYSPAKSNKISRNVDYWTDKAKIEKRFFFRESTTTTTFCGVSWMTKLRNVIWYFNDLILPPHWSEIIRYFIDFSALSIFAMLEIQKTDFPWIISLART